jgi:hypothetical protein
MHRIPRGLIRRLVAGCRAFGQAVTATQDEYSSFSQFGEDMVVRAIFHRFPCTHRGFYVDVGAHHPIRHSNTYSLYQRRWSGICVDPIPGGEELFARYRPRDIFLPIGVAESESTLTYYTFATPEFNTFSAEAANSYPFAWEGSVTTSVKPLRAILRQHLRPRQSIDVLSIDAEGLDLTVAKSNDWTAYRPKLVLTEAMDGGSLDEAATSEIALYMGSEGYVLSGRSPSAYYFLDAKASEYDGSPFLRFV